MHEQHIEDLEPTNPATIADIEGQIKLLRIEIKLGLARRATKRLEAITALLKAQKDHESSAPSMPPTAATESRPQNRTAGSTTV